MTDPTTPAHLTSVTSGRGFGRMPALPSVYGGEIRVYESSAAAAPRVWVFATAPQNLNEPDGPHVEAPIHLEVADAWRLAEQLMHVVRNHYQGTVSGTDYFPANTTED